MFSISHLKARMYQECPRKYYYEYVDERRELKKPRPYLAFGEIMHNVLRDFFRLGSEQRNAEAIQELLDTYWRHYSRRATGFADEKEMREYHERAVKTLEGFIQTQDFQAQPVLTEQELEMPLEKDLVLIGKVERADPEPDGTLSVLDYKTGKYREQYAEADQLQLMTHALLVEHLLQKRVSKTAYLYLEENQLIPATPTPGRLEHAIAAYQKAHRDIRRSQKKRTYNANSSKYCAWCDYLPICEEAQAVGYQPGTAEQGGEEIRDR